MLEVIHAKQSATDTTFPDLSPFMLLVFTTNHINSRGDRDIDNIDYKGNALSRVIFGLSVADNINADINTPTHRFPRREW